MGSAVRCECCSAHDPTRGCRSPGCWRHSPTPKEKDRSKGSKKNEGSSLRPSRSNGCVMSPLSGFAEQIVDRVSPLLLLCVRRERGGCAAKERVKKVRHAFQTLELGVEDDLTRTLRRRSAGLTRLLGLHLVKGFMAFFSILVCNHRQRAVIHLRGLIFCWERR